MQLPHPLIEGRFLRRYKRFFADIELADGTLVTAHTPNTGRMTQCAVTGYRVMVSANNNPARKLKYTLELIEVNGSWVDTHTQRTNRVVEEALRNNRIATLCDYRITPESRYGESRIDFLLTKEQEQCLLEVKNVTLLDPKGHACFPDAVTTRGQKHLKELMQAHRQGYRSIIFFLVQRGEATAFSAANHIDPTYGKLLKEAAAQGVEVMAWQTKVTTTSVTLAKSLPFAP